MFIAELIFRFIYIYIYIYIDTFGTKISKRLLLITSVAIAPTIINNFHLKKK